MKQAAKRWISSILCNRTVWFVIQNTLGKIAAFYSNLNWSRAGWIAQKGEFTTKCRKVFHGCEVLNGPFKGMKYPGFLSYGSALYPKLLGSYEAELHEVIATILRRGYDAVVDIGCAEGYYAIGLGRHFRTAKIYAYDTDRGALQQCKEMAGLNDLGVITGGFCDRAVLTGLDLGRRALIVSDCESYENELFDTSVAQRLRQHDFLVETHDFIRLESTRNVLSAFSETHDCRVIESLDDIIKAYTYNFPELADFSLRERLQVLKEGRPAIMRWVFATARNREADQNIGG